MQTDTFLVGGLVVRPVRHSITPWSGVGLAEFDGPVPEW